MAKYYCFDEHTRIPDIVVISTKTWNKLTDEQKTVLKECAAAATQEYKAAWLAFENQVLDKAVNVNGVQLVRDVDTAAFQKACEPIYAALKTSSPKVYAVVEKIQNWK